MSLELRRGHGRPQAWARGGTWQEGALVKCFCALVVTAK